MDVTSVPTGSKFWEGYGPPPGTCRNEEVPVRPRGLALASGGGDVGNSWGTFLLLKKLFTGPATACTLIGTGISWPFAKTKRSSVMAIKDSGESLVRCLTAVTRPSTFVFRGRMIFPCASKSTLVLASTGSSTRFLFASRGFVNSAQIRVPGAMREVSAVADSGATD